MSNLTVKNDAALAALGDADDFGGLPFKPQLIRCVVGQPITTTKGFEIGKFNFKPSLWPATEKLAGVVVLKFFATRVLYGKGFSASARCGSSDYHVPDSRYKGISPECSYCYAAQWDNQVAPEELSKKRALETELGIKGPSEKPMCSETINIVCVDSRMVPFVLHAQKTQLKAVNQKLINPLMYSGKRIIQTTLDISLNKTGAFFEYEFGNFRDTEDLSKYVQLFNWAKNNSKSALSEEHAKSDAAKAREVGSDFNPNDYEVPEDEVPF